MRRFFRFVEISTKIASVFPFLYGVLFCLLMGYRLNLPLTAFFFIAMLTFDLTTTGTNNYIDASRARAAGVGGETVSGFSVPVAGRILAGLYLASFALAFALVYMAGQRGPAVAGIGAVCFFFGIFYTFGPLALNRTPFGELFSGGVMGYLIPLIVVTLNMPAASGLFAWQYNAGRLTFDLFPAALIRFLVFCLPAAATIANIMLCNNICDLDDDIRVSRYTLPYYLGRVQALHLFSGLYYVALIAASLVFLTGLPVYTGVLTAIVCFVPLRRGLRVFYAKQSKRETFSVCIRLFLLINTVYLAAATLSAYIQ